MNSKRIIPSLILAALLISGCSAPLRSNDYDNEDASIQRTILLKNKEVDMDIQSLVNSGGYDFQNPLVISDPYNDAPLSAIIAFNTDEPMAVRATVVGDTDKDSVICDYPESSAHYLPVIGLYAGRSNQVILEQIKDGQAVQRNDLVIETEPLQKELQNAVTVSGSETEFLPGLTFMSGGSYRNPYAFDSSGNIRWYVQADTDPHGYFPLSNGRFVLISGYTMIKSDSRDYATYLFEMDYLGKLHKVYEVPNGVHHEVIEKEPNGNLLVLSNTLEGHVEDLVLEIDRQSGKIIKELDLNDILVGVYNHAYDWAHMNSISYNPHDNSVILSVRNLSSAVKVDWASGRTRWILADPAIWDNTKYEQYVLQPTTHNLWFYNQHAVSETQEDFDDNPDTLNLMLFDNRVARNELMDLKINEDSNRSSVTCYSINEKNNTVQQIKRFPNSFAYITSNAQLFLHEDRLLANHGSLREGESKEMWGEIYEYKFSTGELLRTYRTRYGFYRAYRLDCSAITAEWSYQ